MSTKGLKALAAVVLVGGGLAVGLWVEARPARGASVLSQAIGFQTSVPVDLAFTEAIKKALPGVVMVVCKESLGSGFIMNHKGAYYIATNRHVVLDKDPKKSCLVNSSLEVTLSSGDTMPAKVYHVDKKIDLAILVPTRTKMPDGSPLPFIKIGNSLLLSPGQWVIAIGHPLGLSNSVSVGVVSALFRGDEGGATYIQTDVAMNHGNSGGPLINLNGEVIGMNTMGIREVQGEIYEGLNFAIPINVIVARIPPCQGCELAPPGYLGIKGEELNATRANALGVKPGNIQITDIMPGSPADLAGLQRLDIIMAVDEVPVTSKSVFYEDINSKTMGDDIILGLDRKGKRFTMQVKLGRNISYITLDVVGLRCEAGPGGSGVRIPAKGIRIGFSADQSGLASGDIILAVGPDRNSLRPVTSCDELLRQLRAVFSYQDSAILHVRKNNGEEKELSIKIPPEPA